MFRKVATAFLQYGLAAMFAAEYNARRKAKRLMLGAILFVVGGIVAYLVALFALLALFFQLADMPTLVQPALFTSAIALLIMVLLALEGWRQISR